MKKKLKPFETPFEYLIETNISDDNVVEFVKRLGDQLAALSHLPTSQNKNETT